MAVAIGALAAAVQGTVAEGWTGMMDNNSSSSSSSSSTGANSTSSSTGDAGGGHPSHPGESEEFIAGSTFVAAMVLILCMMLSHVVKK
jgi:hypothetical protein